MKLHAFLLPFVSLSTVAFVVHAHDTGEEHEHPSLATEAGKPANRISVGGAFGFGLGASLGGDYENCDDATCSARKRPRSAFLTGRLGYELSNGLGVEVDVGMVNGISMSNTRHLTLRGEQMVPVDATITDEVNAAGPFVGFGVSYAFLRKPIVATAVLGVAQWFATIDTTRSGSVATDAAPSPRPLRPESAEAQETATITVLTPELRFGYPLHEHLEIGIGLGAFLAVGAEVRPKVVQSPQSTADDPQPKSGGKAIGFVPQPTATPESALETFALFRASLYLRAPF